MLAYATPRPEEDDDPTYVASKDNTQGDKYTEKSSGISNSFPENNPSDKYSPEPYATLSKTTLSIS